jgi:uncharacterized integral membrane protein
MGIMRLIFAFIIVVLLVFVCFQNVQPTIPVVKVFQESFNDQPLGLVLLVSTAVGMILAFLISLLSEIKLRRTLWLSRREIRKLTTEITALRNLPLAPEGEEAADRPARTATGPKEGSP